MKVKSEEEREVITSKILETLRTLYYNKGRNFTFKACHISKLTGISSWMIANTLKKLPVKIRRKSREVYVYETEFQK